MTDWLALGQRVLAGQPFSHWLGTQLTAFAEGSVELALDMRPEFRQQHGFVHGGVVGYLADNALTFAAGSVLGENVLTAEYKLNYVRPAAGDRLVARAMVIGRGQSLAVCRCEVFVVQDGQEKLCAAAQGTIMRVATA